MQGPGDVPSARVYFFGLLVWARVCFLAIFVKEKSNLANSRVETQNFGDLGLERVKIWQFLPRNANTWHF